MANDGGKRKRTPERRARADGAEETAGRDAAGSAASAGAEPEAPSDDATAAAESPLAGLSELARRALGLGFAGFFLTEETIRKALGDNLPRDWVDFAVDQSDRTRAEFVERLATELVGVVESLDLPALAERLVEGRTIEVNAKIRVGPRDAEPGAAGDEGFELSVVRGSRRR